MGDEWIEEIVKTYKVVYEKDGMSYDMLFLQQIARQLTYKNLKP